MQPAAPILGIAAITIAAVALYVALARPNIGSPDNTATPIPDSSTPASARSVGGYSTSRFLVPFEVELGAAADAEGWLVSDARSMLTFRPAAAFETRGIVLPVSATRVIDPQGRPAAVPDDLIGWLDEQEGVEASAMNLPDGAGPAVFTILGESVQLYEFSVDPAVAPNPYLLQTVDGYGLTMPEEASSGLLFRVPSPAGDVLLIYFGPDREEPVNWTASFLATSESLALR